MAVPSAITDLSTTVASNSPAGSESPSLIDDYLRAQAGFLAQMYSGNAPLLSSVAGTDTITGTVTPTPTAYAAGQVFRFISAGANTTTAVTLNVSSLGAKSVTKLGANALAAGDIPAGAVVQVVYDGTRFQIIGLTSQIAAAINTMTSPLTITVNGTTPITADTSGNISLPLGTANQVQYLNGSKVLSGSANLTFDGTTLTPNALTVTNAVTLNGGTANGVPYLNASKVLTSGSALTFDGLTLKATGNVQAGSGNISLEYSSFEGYLWTYAGNGLTFGVNNAQQARLTSTGLGIGTSSPGAKLDVAGGAKLTGTVVTTAGSDAFSAGSGTGTSTRANIIFKGTDSAGNARNAYIGTNISGTAGNLEFYNNITGLIGTWDTSGNLGLGVTPSAWATGYKVFEFGNGSTQTGALYSNGTNDTWLGSNFYYNGTSYLYKATGNATAIEQTAGAFKFYTAPSGTAGAAITFTQAMALNASGKLIVGPDIALGNMFSVSNTAYGDMAVFRSIPGDGLNPYLVINTSASGITFEENGSSYGALMFKTGAAERARIDSSGNLLVGQTSSGLQNAYGLSLGGVATGGNATINHASGSGSGSGYAYFGYNGASIGSITQNGTTAVAFNTTSDHRLKSNVRTADAKSFDKIRFVDFEWIDGRHDCGVIAHELQSIYPDLVVGEKDAVDEEGKDQYQQVNYIGLIPRMGTLIQQLMAKVEALEARVQALEAK